MFRLRGFDLLIADAAVAGARGDAQAANAIPNPAVGFTVGKTFGYAPDASQCPGCSSVAFSVSVSDQAALWDTLSGKRGLRRDVAGAAVDATTHARADLQRQLEFQLKQQYALAAQAQASLDFALETQKSSEATLGLTQLRLAKGDISAAVNARIETAKLESDQAVDSARQLVRAAQVALAFLLGVRGPVPAFTVDSALLFAQRSRGLLARSAEDWVHEAEAHRPDLRAAEDQERKAGAALALAQRQRVPDLALSLQYSQEGTGPSAIQPPTATIGVSAPLPLFYRQQGEIERAHADQQTAELSAQKLRAQVTSDVESARAQLLGLSALVERMEARLLKSAQTQRDLTQLQFEKGGASLLDYLDAQRTFIAVRSEYLQDRTNYRIALFQLEQAVGEELTP